MKIENIVKGIRSPQVKNSSIRWYFAPLIPAVLWVVFSILSLFTINYRLDPFVIFSVISRFLFPLYAIIFIRRFYFRGGLKPINYNHILNFIGYSISLTYVAYILPGVVADFYNSGVKLPGLTLFTVLSTLCPLSLYLLLRSGRVKVASGYFTAKEVEDEKKRKKDKKLKRDYQKTLRGQRTPLQNIWFEILDPLMWAILWVLLINSTLFQLYQIPSSSMVPEFLEMDRVVASKLFSGPKLPLTRYQLPEFSKTKAGDIVTFNNPEVDNPDSDLHYKNVFTRILQPFVFMLTFSKVDIDAGDNGYPKARQLVKRVIGAPGEKICMVNDKVYKKTEDMDWTLMSDIPGEKEWGHADLFFKENRNSGAQFINPEIRRSLDRAAKMAADIDLVELKGELNKEKYLFLDNLYQADSEALLNFLSSYNRRTLSVVKEAVEGIDSSYRQMMYLNRSTISPSAKDRVIEEFSGKLEDYNLFILFDKINDLTEIVLMDRKLFNDEFVTDLEYPDNSSPYDEFTVNMDGLIKLKTLKLFNMILSSGDFSADIQLVSELKDLSIYTTGLQLISMAEPFTFFGAGNLPEFPAGEGNYIPEGEYFLLGDNRYNSLDSRMGNTSYITPLNPEGGELSQELTVSWKPHTISDEYIHGKVRFILFPFDHFKIFR